MLDPGAQCKVCYVTMACRVNWFMLALTLNPDVVLEDGQLQDIIQLANRRVQYTRESSVGEVL